VLGVKVARVGFALRKRKFMIYIFPIILMTLDVFAGIAYFAKGDLRMGFYWMLAFGLTFCVTFK